MTDQTEPLQITPQLSNEELQTAINAILAAKVPELVPELKALVAEQARRAVHWLAVKPL